MFGTVHERINPKHPAASANATRNRLLGEALGLSDASSAWLHVDGSRDSQVRRSGIGTSQASAAKPSASIPVPLKRSSTRGSSRGKANVAAARTAPRSRSPLTLARVCSPRLRLPVGVVPAPSSQCADTPQTTAATSVAGAETDFTQSIEHTDAVSSGSIQPVAHTHTSGVSLQPMKEAISMPARLSLSPRPPSSLLFLASCRALDSPSPSCASTCDTSSLLDSSIGQSDCHSRRASSDVEQLQLHALPTPSSTSAAETETSGSLEPMLISRTPNSDPSSRENIGPVEELSSVEAAAMDGHHSRQLADHHQQQQQRKQPRRVVQHLGTEQKQKHSEPEKQPKLATVRAESARTWPLANGSVRSMGGSNRAARAHGIATAQEKSRTGSHGRGPSMSRAATLMPPNVRRCNSGFEGCVR